MRPIKLTMSAFGPYAGEQVIDMDSLGTEGLYLITGDTGSGKTTIFDAICYALYDTPSGEERDAKMMRSTYADGGTETFVELVFCHKGKNYTVRRSPEYEREKLRGKGRTKSLATAQLNLPDGCVLADRKQVDAYICQLLGVDKDQFTQISMLAQGDFLKLLIAKTEDRQKIFSRIFGTEGFSRLQKMLMEEAALVRTKRDDARKSIEQYTQGIKCDKDDVISLRVDKAKAGMLLMDELMALVKELIEKDEVLLAEKREKMEAVEKHVADLNLKIGKGEQIEGIKEELARAKELLVILQEDRRSGEREVNDAMLSMPMAEKYTKDAMAIDAELSVYDKADEMEHQIAKDANAMADGKARLVVLQGQAKKKSEEIAAIKAEQETLMGAGEAIERLSAQKEKENTRLELLKELQREIARYEDIRRTVSHLEQEYKDAESCYGNAKSQYDRMDLAYRMGQAGILARDLHDGMPCPVCGAVEHPKLAVLAENVPTDAELESAKLANDKAREAAMQAATAVREKYTQAKEIELSIRSRSKKIFGTELELGDINAKTISACDSVEENLSSLHNLITMEEKKRARKNALGEKLPVEEGALTLLIEKQSGLDRELAALASRLEAEKKQHKELVSGLKFSGRQEALAQRNTLVSESKKITDRKLAAEKHLNEIIQKIKATEGKVEGYVDAIKSVEAIDLEKLKADRTQALIGKRQLELLIQDVKSRKDSNESAWDNLVKKADELGALEKEFAWKDALARTASGQVNGKNKISLETYVQMTYFDRIIRKANLRFSQMTDGQYELKRITQSKDKKSQIGLDLSVVDHNDGSERDVRTLSGGESFMASVSLALGLSDEVSESAGGIRIDTMFVDEGFGSLDAQKTLPMAYKALTGITEGNKLVGIISHSSELKEKIDRQIVVSKDRTGKAKATLVV